MLKVRVQKTEENIKREVTFIINELKDPRITKTFIGVPKVIVSNDVSSCKVFVSTIKSLGYTSKIANLLQKASGLIRFKLGKILQLRTIPKIRFIATNSAEYAINMCKILSDISEVSHIN
ncbi:MAG: 30S ribosome-binding factor RbfA [Oscillospiraceae bacterium]|jgi:ribosome-binding factor A|nr:30S ribosome-binding factor RbfA [Oscillospiraceae bacterium]